MSSHEPAVAAVAELPPSWIPDLFAWLFQRVEASAPAVISGALPDRCVEDHFVEFHAVLKAIGDAPDGYAPKSVREFLSQGSTGGVALVALMRQLIVLLAIDEAFAEMRLGSGRLRGVPIPPCIAAVRAWYRANGNCAKKADWIVLPAELVAPDDSHEPLARKSGVSTRNLLHCLKVLIRAELPSPWRVAMVCGVPSRGFGPGTRVDPRSHDLLRIAIAPLAESRTDALLSGLAFGGEARLVVHLDEEQERRLITRAGRVLQLAAEEGANIVVMPEWVVSSAVVRGIQVAIRDMAKRGHSLQLVIAGSGPTAESSPESDVPYAECVVLDGLGNCVWRQRKLHPWVMNAKAQTDAGLDPDPLGRREHFYPGDTVVVADTPIGRCMVLICEDAQQDTPGRRVLDALQPRWVFVPILDTPIAVYRWTAEKAAELSRTFGATVVVCNSLVLAPDVAPSPAVFGWIVSRLDPRRFVKADVVPLGPRAADDRPIVRTVRWDPDAAPWRLLIEGPPKGILS